MREKQNVLPKFYRWISTAMIIILMTLMIPAMPGEASARSTAISRYRALLNRSRISVLPQGQMVFNTYDEYVRYWSSGRSDVKFCLAYIDGDSIPELILRDHRYGYGVWTYTNGHFRCLQWADAYSQPVGYYKKKGVLRDNEGTEGAFLDRNYYKLQAGKKKQHLQYEHCFDNQYKVNVLSRYIRSGNRWKSASSGVFYKNLKKYTGGASMSRIYLHNNTAANKKKYLK